SDGQPDHEHQERHGRGEGDVPDQGAEEGGGKGRLEQEPTEVVEPDADLPTLGQSLTVLVVEGTTLVVGVIGLAGLGVLDTVTCVVVDVLGVALEGTGQTAGADPGTVGGGHRELLEFVTARVDLGGGQDG